MYEIKEVVLKNKLQEKYRLVITFTNPEMAIIGEFLMSDAGLLAGDVLSQFQAVLQGEVEKKAVTGNRCHLTIEKNHTFVEDLFADIDDALAYEPYLIETKVLYDLTIMWLSKVKAHKNNQAN